jgi:hypothetical protein
MADEGNDDKGSGGDGEGKAKAEPKPEIAFKTKAEFHAEVDRKTKAAVTKAIEETKRALLEGLGVESEEELPTIVETVKKGKAAVTETDAIKNAHAKLTKQHATLQEQYSAAISWKHKSLRQSALNAFASKTVDLETLAALVEPKIVIGDDDSVTGPNGKALEDLVDDIFKAKPFLKVPDNTPGAGTNPKGGKSDGGDKSKAKGKESQTNDTPPPNGNYRKPQVGAAVVAALQALKNEGGGGP